jgi:hypothetical protein
VTPFVRERKKTMRRMLTAGLLLLAACSDCCDDDHHEPPPRLVSILVEVYDPVTNFVWENVDVTILEADQEWSGGTYVSPYLDTYLTDATGRVLLDEYALAFAEIGFLEDADGRAVIYPGKFEDEATVVLEISAVGFMSVIVEVPVSWDEPDVFVEVPFN